MTSEWCCAPFTVPKPPPIKRYDVCISWSYSNALVRSLHILCHGAFSKLLAPILCAWVGGRGGGVQQCGLSTLPPLSKLHKSTKLVRSLRLP